MSNIQHGGPRRRPLSAGALVSLGMLLGCAISLVTSWVVIAVWLGPS